MIGINNCQLSLKKLCMIYLIGISICANYFLQYLLNNIDILAFVSFCLITDYPLLIISPIHRYS